MSVFANDPFASHKEVGAVLGKTANHVSLVVYNVYTKMRANGTKIEGNQLRMRQQSTLAWINFVKSQEQ